MSINSLLLSEFPEAQLLSSGCNGDVFIHTSTVVLKSLSLDGFDVEPLQLWETFEGDLEPAEVLAMQWANSVNDLVVKYKSHILFEEVGCIIAMERIYPCLPTAFSKEEIEAAIMVADEQLNQLWQSGWVHRDLKRPEYLIRDSDSQDVLYNNIVLTEVGGKCVIKLIDCGCSLLEQYDDLDQIELELARDILNWQDFKRWILSYPRKH